MDIKYNVLGEKMTIELPKRIDTEASLEFEKEMYCILNSGTNYKTIIDAARLEYISKSGLRALKKLRLEFGDLKMINIRPEIHEIMKDNDYTELYS
ncbi:MAG: STAS domain-containing protein [Eubacterium sp.]|nr:STAS domain-containing protein [Eubacterium sp.]